MFEPLLPVLAKVIDPWPPEMAATLAPEASMTTLPWAVERALVLAWREVAPGSIKVSDLWPEASPGFPAIRWALEGTWPPEWDGASVRFRSWQVRIALDLAKAMESGARQVALHAPAGDVLVPMAVQDLLAMAAQLARLYGLEPEWPQVRVVVPSAGHVQRRAWELFREALAQEPGAKAIPWVQVMWEPGLEVARDGWFELHLAAWSPQEAFAAAQRLRQIPVSLWPTGLPPETADFFARRLFRIPGLYAKQRQVLARLVARQSTLTILPTGYGKSLCYQLPALLFPGRVLVVAPLRSLMRDQVHGLQALGVTGAAYIMAAGTGTGTDPNQVLAGFLAGAHYLLYVSPERLQIEGFTDLLAREPDPQIGLVAIDEAHCISEWGHDFRPAYLQLPSFVRSLHGQRTPPVVLATTATASNLVEQDILAILELDREAVVRGETLDRPELSLSVHPVRQADRPREIQRLIRSLVPTALNLAPEELIPNRPPYPHAGVIFTIYANPHGRTTYSYGVGPLRELLTRDLGLADHLVDIHASDTVEQCPHCNSYSFVGRQPYECLRCGRKFDKPLAPQDWDQRVMATQDRFKRDEFPLLVATKGYGMGIDKRNIRFIIHYGFAASLEAYYQEAGRAGRDHRHSHCALMYEAPVPECAMQHIAHAVSEAGVRYPPCLVGENLRFYKCPYGLPAYCDFARQARFLVESYPPVQQVVDHVLRIWQQVEASPHRVVRLALSRHDGERTREQLALVRLHMLGLIARYDLRYNQNLEAVARIEKPERATAGELRRRLLDHVRKANRLLPGPHRDPERPALEARLQRDVDVAVPAGNEDRTPTPQEVKAALTLLVTEIHREVQKMRMDTLRNLHFYAVQTRECRRAFLLGALQSSRSIQRCGFCDVCRPDLRFPAERAVVSPDEAAVAHLLQEFQQVTALPDLDRTVGLVQAIKEAGAIASFMGRADSFLERDPDNFGALVLSGLLHVLAGGAESEAVGWSRLAHAADTAIRRYGNRDLARSLVLYLGQLWPDRALDVADRAGGAFDNPEDLEWLLTTAEALGAPPERVLALAVLAALAARSHFVASLRRAPARMSTTALLRRAPQ